MSALRWTQVTPDLPDHLEARDPQGRLLEVWREGRDWAWRVWPAGPALRPIAYGRNMTRQAARTAARRSVQ